MLQLPADLLESISRRALIAYPDECCGILLGTSSPGDITVQHALEAPNIAPLSERTTRYTIDPAAILHADAFARLHNLDIVGFYHSHPDHPARPSRTDTSLAWETYVYLIVSITTDTVLEANAYRFLPPPAPPQEVPLLVIDARPDGQ
jgi:proteasome lid subunit RPN8/RPN11